LTMASNTEVARELLLTTGGPAPDGRLESVNPGGCVARWYGIEST